MKSVVFVVVAVMVLGVRGLDVPDTSTCQWQTIDPDKDVPPEVGTFASESLIASFRADYGVRLARINSAKVQNVNGKNYDLEILFEFTSCSSSRCYDDIHDFTLCPKTYGAQCNIKVFHQFWSYTLKVLSYSCVA